jgi:hypothetical protein
MHPSVPLNTPQEQNQLRDAKAGSTGERWMVLGSGPGDQRILARRAAGFDAMIEQAADLEESRTVALLERYAGVLGRAG